MADSGTSRYQLRVKNRIEQRTLNPRVRGSSPWRRTRTDLGFAAPGHFYVSVLSPCRLRVSSGARESRPGRRGPVRNCHDQAVSDLTARTESATGARSSPSRGPGVSPDQRRDGRIAAELFQAPATVRADAPDRDAQLCADLRIRH
jgi:hypothetical protein